MARRKKRPIPAETLESFLARGGEVKKVEANEYYGKPYTRFGFYQLKEAYTKQCFKPQDSFKRHRAKQRNEK